MKLKLIYRNNSTGNDIVAYFKKNCLEMECFNFEINGEEYQEIVAEFDPPDFELIINDIQPILNCLHNETCESILTLNGITSDLSKSQSTNKIYEILLFNMSIISINQVTYTKTTINQKYISEKQVPKISELAKKTANLMGLDFAMVKINSNGQRKLTVLEVNPCPDIRSKDKKALFSHLEEMVKQYVQYINKKPVVKLGADPEFMIANSRNDKMIPASEFFPREGTVGCDNIRIPNRQQRPIAELRPHPDTSPFVLQTNLKSSLEQANRMVPYKNIKMLAGSQPFPGYSIGGHIHFSGLNINGHILRTLNNYLGLPIFMIENQQTSVKRRKKYGFLCDFRVKEYGGFEYRTPGSWLVSPEISLAALCLAKLVSSNYVHLRRNFFYSIEAYRAFYRGDTQFFKSQFYILWDDIKNLDDYSMYEQELAIIPQMIEQDQSWDEIADIRKTWHLKKNYSKRYVSARTGTGTGSTVVYSSSINRQTSSNRRAYTASNSYHSARRYML